MLSVIVPTFNEAANVAAAIESAWAAGAAEVIVSDGGSSDRTCAIAKDCAASVVDGRKESAAGRGPQQNAGAAVATGDVLLFLHADCRLPPDAQTQIEQQPQALGGGFAQRIDADGRRFRWLEAGNAWRGRRGLLYGDQAIWVRREVFDRVGGFPDWPLFEDVELGRRIGRKRFGTVLPGPVVVSARRWRSRGVIRQTATNWFLLAAYRCGVSPGRLAVWYRSLR